MAWGAEFEKTNAFFEKSNVNKFEDMNAKKFEELNANFEKANARSGSSSHPHHIEPKIDGSSFQAGGSSQQNQTAGKRMGQVVMSLLSGVPHPAGSSKDTSKPYQNPRDAALAPPSVLSQILGEPSIEHDHPEDSTIRRHSSASHQEAHLLGGGGGYEDEGNLKLRC
ncbi:hypothetical protein G7046_g9145 [Stylonectria norvegica]|nr:hypothetical protein G7046_g9145 [Stylonectria norvegica]